MRVLDNQKAAIARRGIALLIMIVALVLLLAFSAVLLGLARDRLLNLRRRESAVQAELLAESALDRAAAKLALDPTYSGETWTISARELGGRDDARVTIKIAGVSKRPNRREARVVADYPIDPTRRARRSQSLFIDLEPESKQ